MPLSKKKSVKNWLTLQYYLKNSIIRGDKQIDNLLTTASYQKYVWDRWKPKTHQDEEFNSWKFYALLCFSLRTTASDISFSLIFLCLGFWTSKYIYEKILFLKMEIEYFMMYSIVKREQEHRRHKNYVYGMWNSYA